MSAGEGLPEGLPEGLAEGHRAWGAAVEGTDLSAYADVVCEDVVWLPPGAAPVEGRDAFRGWLEPFFEAYDYEFSIEDPTFRSAGRWALEDGRFRTRMTSREDGRTTEHEGRFVALWRREGNGRWRIERYVDVTEAKDTG